MGNLHAIPSIWRLHFNDAIEKADMDTVAWRNVYDYTSWNISQISLK
jgi:hypothetical protein